MGWASGSDLANAIWNDIKDGFKSDDARKNAAKAIIDNFQEFDCDTIYECTELVEAAGLDIDWEDYS